MERRKILIKHSSILVPEYELGESERIEKSLSVRNEYNFTTNPIGFSYDEDTKILRLPRGLDIDFILRELNGYKHMDYESDPFQKVTIKMTSPPKNTLQKKSISFLTGLGEFRHIANKSQLALTLSTGSGKTYCTIAAISHYGVKSMIITHKNNIKDQWIASFQHHSNVDKYSILDLSSSAKIDSLLRKIDSGRQVNYKVYVTNRRTLTSYAKKNGWYAVGELFEKLGIGIKVFDEAHLELHANILIDLYTNTNRTIYLTATLDRSHHRESRVLNLYFKNVPVYGDESKHINKKNMRYLVIEMDSRPTFIEKTDVISSPITGFSANAHADYLVTSDEYFNILKDLLTQMNLSKTFAKVLVLSSTINSTFKMKEIIDEMNLGVPTSVFNSEIDRDEKKYILEKGRIICSTSKSIGTGDDIPHLQHIINTESYKSTVTADQVSGRLREEGTYVEIVDKAFTKSYEWYKHRRNTIQAKASKYGVKKI